MEGKITGWYPDNSAYMFHITDRRLHIESYDYTATEKLLVKGLLAVAGLVAGMSPYGAFHKLQANVLKGEINAAMAKTGEWLAIPLEEIAGVERVNFDGIQKFASMGAFLVRIAFANPNLPPIVCKTFAGHREHRRMMSAFEKDFIRVTGRLLHGAKERDCPKCRKPICAASTACMHCGNTVSRAPEPPRSRHRNKETPGGAPSDPSAYRDDYSPPAPGLKPWQMTLLVLGIIWLSLSFLGCMIMVVAR